MSFMGHVLGADRSERQAAQLRMICQGLLFRVVQKSREIRNRGYVVMLTSPTQGAGVSRIATTLADTLNRAEPECAVSLDCRNIDCNLYDFADPNDASQRKAIEDLWATEMQSTSGENWHGIQESLARSLDRFRQLYRYVLIDCPSLRESQDAVCLAPLVDGIILVVEANKTQRDQLLYAERTIESAKGKILGHVLNRRTYVIPDWLSRKMEAISL